MNMKHFFIYIRVANFSQLTEEQRTEWEKRTKNENAQRELNKGININRISDEINSNAPH